MSDVFPDDTIRALSGPLDPNRVAVMTDGPQSGIPYLEAHDVIRTANTIFGFGNWGFELLALPTPHEGLDKNSKPYTVWMAHGRLTVKGGVAFSDLGTNLQSGPGGPATEMASKGAVSDCLKRCLKQYGDQFGLALYDKHMSRADLEAAFAGDSDEPRPTATKPAEARPVTETVQRFLDMKKLAVEQGIGIAYLVRALGGPSDQPAEGQSRWFAQSGALSLEAWLMTNPDKGIRDLVDRAGDYKRAAVAS